MIPIQNNWTPPTNNIIHIIEGHPETGSPKANVLIITTNIKTNAKTQNINPSIVDIISGAVENAIIPSKQEVEMNPRAHSAKLRVMEKL